MSKDMQHIWSTCLDEIGELKEKMINIVWQIVYMILVEYLIFSGFVTDQLFQGMYSFVYKLQRGLNEKIV